MFHVLYINNRDVYIQSVYIILRIQLPKICLDYVRMRSLNKVTYNDNIRLSVIYLTENHRKAWEDSEHLVKTRNKVLGVVRYVRSSHLIVRFYNRFNFDSVMRGH